MSIENAANDLGNTIDKLSCLQVGKTTVGAKEITFLCRWTDEPRWMEIMTRFLLYEKGWQSFFAKTFFVRADEQTGKKGVVAGWYLAFRADDIEAVAEQIGALFLSCAADLDGATDFSAVNPLGAEVYEVPLVGVTADRNTFPNTPGKGVRATV